MKKFFFLAVAAVAALTANAQGAWHAVGVNGADTVVTVCEIPNLTVALVDGAGDWAVKGAISEDTKVTVGDEAFEGSYAQGSTNGMKGGLDKEGTVSAHIELTPAAAGTIHVVAKFGKNKPIWAAKVPAAEVEDVDVADMSAYLIEGFSAVEPETLLYIKDDGTGLQDVEAAAEVYAALPLAVEAGYTYYFWVSGSKLMLCGLVFESDGQTGLNEVEAVKAIKRVVNGQIVIEKNGVLYNVLGAQL